MLELFSERTERKQVHAVSIPKIGSDETSSKKNDLLLLFPREIGSFTSQKKKKICGCMGRVQHKLLLFYFPFPFLFPFYFISKESYGWMDRIDMDVCLLNMTFFFRYAQFPLKIWI